MREFVIVGRPNSGKTMLTLNFARFVGSKSIDVTFRDVEGMLNCRHYDIEAAKRELCSSTFHKTRCLQSIILKMPVGKTTAQFKLTDTCGVAEKIHPEEGIRRGMAQTLSLLRGADCILHVVDGAAITLEYLSDGNNIDREIYNYGTAKQNYLLLLNKMDLPAAKSSFLMVRDVFSQAPVIPISALHGDGFKEVKAYVARNY